MLGSNASIAGPNIVLNTIVAESLKVFADQLEVAEDKELTIKKLIKKNVTKHARIIFNGNNYSDEWVAEAEHRGLLNLKSTIDALPYFVSDKNIKLFTEHGIYTKAEMLSRLEINYENYSKTINIEALTLLDMAKKDVLPAVSAYAAELANTILSKKSVSKDIPCLMEESLVKKLSVLTGELYQKTEKLEKVLTQTAAITDPEKSAVAYYEDVFAAMQDLRATADALEDITSAEYWPYPSYAELLFNV